MEEKIYVVVRNYEHDGTNVVCFKNKEDAKDYAIKQAKQAHEYFEFEKYLDEKFEDCCFDWERKSIVLHADGSVELWGYECKSVVIELLETTIK